MRRLCVLLLTALIAVCASYCTWDTVETSQVGQGYGSSQQGTQVYGIVLQGAVASMTVQGFQYAGATLHGNPLINLRVEKGELVAEQNQVTLRNTALAEAHVFAQVH